MSATSERSPAEVRALAATDAQAHDMQSAVAYWARDAAQAARLGQLGPARECLNQALACLGMLETRLTEVEAQQ